MTTNNDKKYSAGRAGSDGAFMGTQKGVPMTPNLVQNPKPSMQASMPSDSKRPMRFKTNSDQGSGPNGNL